MQLLKEYFSKNEQEKADKALCLSLYSTYKEQLFFRSCKAFHFTSSGFVVNKEHTKGLFVLHNIYNTYSFPGGHSDGNQDFFQVAWQEVLEETGLRSVTPIFPSPVAIDVLPVKSHKKNGEFISAHLHLSLTYLFEAEENQPLAIKSDENSQVVWLELNYIDSYNMEDYMKTLYKKVIALL